MAQDKQQLREELAKLHETMERILDTLGSLMTAVRDLDSRMYSLEGSVSSKTYTTPASPYPTYSGSTYITSPNTVYGPPWPDPYGGREDSL